MKKITFLLAFLFSLACISAQSGYKFAAKVYNTYSIDKQYQNGLKYHYFFNPSIAFQFRNHKRGWHELILNQGYGVLGKTTRNIYDSLSIPHSIEGQGFNFSSTVSYEYNWNVLRNSHKWNPSIGIGTKTSVLSGSFHSLNQKNYVSNYSSIHVQTYLVPRIIYNFSPRLFGDFNIPINLFYIDAKTSKYRNSFSNYPSTITNSHFDGDYNFENFSLRMGIGYRF